MTVNLLAELLVATAITPDSLGWYVPCCGHPAPIPRSGAVHVTDCSSCSTTQTQPPDLAWEDFRAVL